MGSPLLLCQKKGYTLTAVSGKYEAEKGVYTACDDVADQNSAERCRGSGQAGYTLGSRTVYTGLL
jgi:hypothetical protein